MRYKQNELALAIDKSFSKLISYQRNLPEMTSDNPMDGHKGTKIRP